MASPYGDAWMANSACRPVAAARGGGGHAEEMSRLKHSFGDGRPCGRGEGSSARAPCLRPLQTSSLPSLWLPLVPMMAARWASGRRWADGMGDAGCCVCGCLLFLLPGGVASDAACPCAACGVSLGYGHGYGSRGDVQ